jgi:hypothetical protein
MLFKELKAHYRLDQMPSSRHPGVETLLFAAILTLVASHALLEAVRRRTPPDRAIPILRWAAVFESLAPALLTKILGDILSRRHRVDPWSLLLSQAVDPNLTRPTALMGKVA